MCELDPCSLHSLTVAALTATAPVPAAAASGAPHAPEAAGAPHAQGAQTAKCPELSRKLQWYGHNRAALQRLIDERDSCGRSERAGGASGPRPVAAFDWDNTVVKNDTTDVTLAWALDHDKILRPRSWSATSKWLTPAADRALTEACGTSVPVGSPLPTSTGTACTDEISEIRTEAQTMNGDPASGGRWNPVVRCPSTPGWPSCSSATLSVRSLRTRKRGARRASPRPWAAR